jgi:tetratricopeptide (TPR) repeat protein
MGSRALMCLLCLCWLVPSNAFASPTTEAKARYDSGTGHYNLAEYKEALQDFKEAYRLIRHPALIFNIAQCYRQLNDPDQAVIFYRAFRREAPNAPNRADIDRLIGEMERAVQEKRASQPPTGVEPSSTRLHSSSTPGPRLPRPLPRPNQWSRNGPVPGHW